MRQLSSHSILVTGAAGFIGSRVSDLLLSDGYHVIGVDNLNDAYDVRLKKWRLDQLLQRSHFEFHHLDIVDRDALRGAVADWCRRNTASLDGSIDAVIHLAARAGVRQSIENPWIYVDSNITGTLNVLELCRTAGVPKIVLASTSSLYGPNAPRPFREDGNTDHPLSPYAATKKGSEALCHSYHHLYGIDVTVLRYFTVYGPAGRPDMALFRFVQRISEGKSITIYGDGSQERDFTFVDDIARGTVAALKPLGYEVINLGSDEPIPLKHALNLLEDLLDRKAITVNEPRHPADMLRTWADVTKAHSLLGWHSQTSFRDGLGHLVDWYEQNRGWAREVNTE